MLLTLLLGAVAGSAMADDSYTAEVVGRDVYIRALPGTNEYAVGKISAPARVTVIRRAGEWVKILPPPGVFSIISKQYVQLDADGVTGTVTGNSVRVRAGTDLRNMGSITKHWAVQHHLNKGDRVEVIGQGSDFYKIRPTGKAAVWMSARYVRLPGEAAPVADRPVERPTPRPAVAPSGAAAAFDEAEVALKAEWARPLGQRRLEPILRQYQAIPAAAGTPLRRAVDSRIAFLTKAIARQDSYRKVRAMDERRGGILVEQEAEAPAKPEERVDETPEPAAPFAASGVLRVSEIYRGEGAGQRYFLDDPDKSRVNAYVQCTSGRINLGQYTGRLVGVYGPVQRGRFQGLDLIEAEKLVLIESGASVGAAEVAPPPAEDPTRREEDDEGYPAGPGELPTGVPGEEATDATPEREGEATEPEEERRWTAPEEDSTETVTVEPDKTPEGEEIDATEAEEPAPEPKKTERVIMTPPVKPDRPAGAGERREPPAKPERPKRPTVDRPRWESDDDWKPPTSTPPKREKATTVRRPKRDEEPGETEKAEEPAAEAPGVEERREIKRPVKREEPARPRPKGETIEIITPLPSDVPEGDDTDDGVDESQYE
jgi:hypothetical protein